MARDSYLIYSEDGSTLRGVANNLETAERLDLLLSADAARQSLLSEFTYESSARRNPSDDEDAYMFLEAQLALREASRTALVEKNQEIRSALAKFGVEDASLLTKRAFKGYKGAAQKGVPREKRGEFAKKFALVEQMYEERRALIVVYIQTSLFPELDAQATLPVRDISFFEELKRLLIKGYTPASIQDLANAVDPSRFVDRPDFSDDVPAVPGDALKELTKGLDSLMPFLELIEPYVAQNNASNLRNFLRQMTADERKAFTKKFLGKKKIDPAFIVDHAVAPRLMWTLAAFRLGELESLSSSFSADENSFIQYYQGESPGIEYVVAALHYMGSGEMEKPFDKKSRVLEKPPERAGDAFKKLLAEFGYSVDGDTKTAEACRVAASIALGGSVALNYAMGRKTPPVDKLYDKILVANSGGVRLGGAEMFEALVEAEYETLEEYTLTVMLYCFGFLKQVRETAFSYETRFLPISNATGYRKFLVDKLSDYFFLDAEKSLTINESELEALAREIQRYVSKSGDAQKMVEVFGDTPAYSLQNNRSTLNVWDDSYASLMEYPKLWALFQSKPDATPSDEQIWILDFVAHCAVCCIAAELLYFRKRKSFACATFLNTASISNVEDPVECWKLNTFNPLNLFCGHSSISACCLVPYGAGGTAAMRGALTNKENFVLFYFRERKLFAGLTAEFLLTAESDALTELKDQIVEKVGDYPESFVSGLPQLSVFKKPKPAALTKILSKKISDSGVMQFDGMEGKAAAALPVDLEGVAGNANVSVINAVAERIDALLYTPQSDVSPALRVEFEGEEAKPEAYIDHSPSSQNSVPLTAIGFEEVAIAPVADSVVVHLEDKGFGSFEIQSLSYYKNERLVLEPKPEETLNLIVALAYPFFAKVFPLNAKNVVLNLSNTATTYAESKRLLEEVAKKFFKPEWLLKDRNGSIRGKSIAKTLRERTPESLTILAEGGHTKVALPS